MYIILQQHKPAKTSDFQRFLFVSIICVNIRLTACRVSFTICMFAGIN